MREKKSPLPGSLVYSIRRPDDGPNRDLYGGAPLSCRRDVAFSRFRKSWIIGTIRTMSIGPVERIRCRCIFVFGAILNIGVVKLMPYELDRPALLRAIEQIKGDNAEAPILTSWAYSDYHFLHLMLPGTKIFNVNTPTRNGQLAPPNKAWKARLSRWYGAFYIDNSKSLSSQLDGQVAYYIGWKKFPPAENMQNFANIMGLDYVVELISQMPLKDHLKESWLWYSSDFELTFVGRSGQYEFYRVNLVDGIPFEGGGKRS